MDALEPAGEVARKLPGGEPQHVVDLLAEVDRPGLHVQVVEDVEGDRQKRLQPRVVLGERRLGRGAVDPERREVTSLPAGRGTAATTSNAAPT